ncbi:F0F1 ATP synthase subunit A [Flavobacteriaceae bacterium Ap0902]|nr:F0F1 ATP synthase subunit A [Flavobacteriaceae bacterium Ap0902]
MNRIKLLGLVLSLLFFQLSFAQSIEEEIEEVPRISDHHDTEHDSKFDLVGTIMHHISDAHEWHFWGEGENGVALPLPVILIDNGLKVFSSHGFYHGDGIVENGGEHYVLHHEKIYKTDVTGTLTMDEEGHPTNVKPLDFSITKNVTMMLVGALLLILLFGSVARSYKKGMVPRGLAGFLEPLVVFVREDIAIPNIGERKYKKYMPYLLTLFFFIWILNLMGLIPGAANVTGNIAFTMVLAVIALLVVNISGNKYYWKHIFDPLGDGMPWYGKILIYPILIPVEVVGIFTKPIALMIRLFANMTAGHIIILSFISLIFILGTVAVSPASILLTLFINVLELLVAALQAYIFTLLTALFIGMAVVEHEEH